LIISEPTGETAMRKLAGQVVVISGAAGGLGAAFARRFVAAGARVALLDLDGAAAEKLAAELGAKAGRSLGLCVDITDPRACEAAMAGVLEALGPVDVLINNAGITHRSAFRETDADVLRRVMEVNYFGAVILTKAALPSLIARRGRIVVISSVAGFAPVLGRTGYAASKHALHGLFGSLRAELAPAGVGVSIVCPGFTSTGISTAALGGDGTITRHPQSTTGRIATPEAVAEAVLRATVRGKNLTVLSAVGRLSWLASRAAPKLYEKMMARRLASELER
jgi:NAD(P)-dependent dehydrogenase (short-subunit alcohol dehydrogenase family)